MVQRQTGILFTINGMTALSFAFLLPIMSLFLVSELNAQPAFIGIYTTLTAISTLLVSPKITALIDKGVSSKALFILSLFGIVMASAGFFMASEFWHALIIGCVLMPLASSSVPLILTIIRNYADSTGADSTKLNSQMRSSVSLLWIFGPPLAFMSVDKLGFQSNFVLAAAIALVVVVIVMLCFESPTVNHSEKQTSKNSQLPRSVWGLGAVVLLANIANSTYINAMPIYLIQELAFSKSSPGWLLGLTALVEIPVMLLAANWAGRIGKVAVMKMGFMAGAVFYAAMYLSSSLEAFLVLQIINGVFFGIFVGLGITIMQDIAPNNIGKASAFYTNAMLLGTMVGTSLMGIISQYYGFRAPLLLCFTAIVAALVGLIIFDRKSQKVKVEGNVEQIIS